MNLEELRKLADSFFEWPTKDHNHVTLTSALLFAQHVLRMAQQEEPVEYQRRMRPLWDSQVVWTPWEKCTKGTYEDCIRVPVLHDWEHQVRALYTAPQAQPSGNPVGVVREFHVDWRDHKPPEGTELYSYGSLGPSLLEQSDLEFIAARLGRVAKRVGYPMPSGDAQFIVSVSGSILGAIARILDGDTREKQAQPAPIPTGWQRIETAPEGLHLRAAWVYNVPNHDWMIEVHSGYVDDYGMFVNQYGDTYGIAPNGYFGWQPQPPAPGGEG